jgi:molybdate-binding protein
MTARIADQAAGVLQGAADAVQGVKHQAASDDLSPHPVGRDVYAVLENDAAAGMNRLERLGKQASQMEAGMAAPAGPEAGQ